MKLKIYDLLGREIESLTEELYSAGTHSVVWDAARLNSSVYFYTLEANNFVHTRKLILLK